MAEHEVLAQERCHRAEGGLHGGAGVRHTRRGGGRAAHAAARRAVVRADHLRHLTRVSAGVARRGGTLRAGRDAGYATLLGGGGAADDDEGAETRRIGALHSDDVVTRPMYGDRGDRGERSERARRLET